MEPDMHSAAAAAADTDATNPSAARLAALGADGPAPDADADFARWLAGRAGALLLDLRDELGFVDVTRLKDEGDRRSHELLMSELATHRPGDAVLSEEGVRDAPERLAADRVWIIDPLDGTREYGEQGRSDWAVHVALWSAAATTDSKLIAGAVALPAMGKVLVSDPAPAYPRRIGDGRLRLVVSRSRAPEFLKAIAEQLDAEWVPLGSAGAKISAVVTGDVDIYVHAGGQYEWDSAAPVAVAQAAGLFTSRVDGTPLTYNHANPWLPDLVVCRVEVADRLLPLLEGLA
jgi:3'(2'), 5'-bisphosphate nucleotidase